MTTAANTRIYVVTRAANGSESRLVRATSQASALRHVVEDTHSVGLASQDELVDLLTGGIKVEEAGAEVTEAAG